MSAQIMDRIGRIHLAWKRHVAQNLAPYEITPKQIFLLRELRARRALTPSEIATMLYADRPTTTSMLSTLERAGWITRRRDPDQDPWARRRVERPRYQRRRLPDRLPPRRDGPLAGTLTDCCVGTTARQAYERGFGAVVASDATATSLPEMHEAELKILRRAFARVLDVEQILSELPAIAPSDEATRRASSPRMSAG